MTRILTNKERSAAIRAELKKLGYNSKQVSVRSGFCGYSVYSDIIIKDLKADRKAIEKACLKFQSIDYDERTQEVLEGGNTYISVRYGDNLEPAIEEEMKKLDSFVSELETEQKTIKRSNADYIIYKQGDFYCMVISENKDGYGSFKILPTDKINNFKYMLAREFVTDFNY